MSDKESREIQDADDTKDRGNLHREYSPTYFNYHRNALIFLGTTVLINLFDVEFSLKDYAFISSLSPVLSESLPVLLWVSGLYCFICFFIEWYSQSYPHYFEVSDNNEEIIRRIEELRSFTASTERSISLINDSYQQLANFAKDWDAFEASNKKELLGKAWKDVRPFVNEVESRRSTIELKTQDVSTLIGGVITFVRDLESGIGVEKLEVNPHLKKELDAYYEKATEFGNDLNDQRVHLGALEERVGYTFETLVRKSDMQTKHIDSLIRSINSELVTFEEKAKDYAENIGDAKRLVRLNKFGNFIVFFKSFVSGIGIVSLALIVSLLTFFSWTWG